MSLLSCDVVWQDRFSLDVRINNETVYRQRGGSNWLYKVLFQLWLILQNTVAVPNQHHHDGMTQQDDYWYFNANLGARTGQLRAR